MLFKSELLLAFGASEGERDVEDDAASARDGDVED